MADAPSARPRRIAIDRSAGASVSKAWAMSGNSANGRPPSIANAVDALRAAGATHSDGRERLRQQALVESAALAQLRIDDEQPLCRDPARARCGTRRRSVRVHAHRSGRLRWTHARPFPFRTWQVFPGLPGDAMRPALRSADSQHPPPAAFRAEPAVRRASRATAGDSVRLTSVQAPPEFRRAARIPARRPSLWGDAGIRQSASVRTELSKRACFSGAARLAAQFANGGPLRARRQQPVRKMCARPLVLQ